MADRSSCHGLAAEWDAIESIRLRMREPGTWLFIGDTSAEVTNKVAMSNQDFLLPMLLRLHKAGLKLPDIEGLRGVVKELYNLNGREPDESRVDDDAWACRKLLVHVKRKAQKKLVSLDTCLQLLHIF